MPPRQETQTEINCIKSSSSGRINDDSESEVDENDVYERTNVNRSDHVSKDLWTNEGEQKIPPTTSLPILVFIDMFAVSLVVPLLFQYYKNAGVTSANQRELLSSVFSTSQIVGGMALGAMADSNILRRKTLLFLSFGGSAVAYAMIAFGGYHALILSRILVGLVKQTMTVSTSILIQHTTDDNRTKYMGRLQSSSTASWVLGPSAGAILFKYVDERAPALLACGLFLLNMGLAAFLLNDRMEEESPHTTDQDKKKKSSDFLTNLKACFSSQALGSVIAGTLLFSWINRATSYSSMGSYYEDMYGMEPHHRGYIQSYQQVLGFIVSSLFISPLLSRMGGERSAVCLAALILATATFLEMGRSLTFFLVALSPAISLSLTMMNVSLRSLLTTVAPKDSIFSVLAALDVMQNASAVTVPFYRTFLFRVLGGGACHSSMQGDPEPIAWVLSSGLHWVVAAAALTYLLRPDRPRNSKQTSTTKTEKVE